MNFYRQHNRILAAGCWLILMLFIHGVKLLHNHSNRIAIIACNAASHAEHNCVVFSEDHSGEDCSACEYKFNNDADDCVINFLPKGLTYSNYKECFSAQYRFHFYSHTDNKGPPSLS